MASEFFTILTAAGREKIAAALAEQQQIFLQTMVVGDGNGQYVEPSETQTSVVNEVWRGQLNTLKLAPENPAWVIAEAVLPEDVGGWYIREVGLVDKDGDLIAIGKFPETYKPKLPAGASKQIVIRAVMEVTNATVVTLMIDPTVVVATREYVDFSIDEHEKSRNHPDATLTQKGFTQLNNSVDSTLETQAATPRAVKEAYDKANEALVKAGADKPHKHVWGDITGVPDGTTAQKGIVKLNSATNSTSTTEAATPSAVKAAYDKASAAAPANHSHYQFFTANGTFTVPAGVTQVFVEMLGGGGGGGGGAANYNGEVNHATGGKGGACGESRITIITVLPSKIYTVSVGSGGAGGAAGYMPKPPNNDRHWVMTPVAGASGIDGGDSVFANVVTKGGAGGIGGNYSVLLKASGGSMIVPDSSSGSIGMNSSFGQGGSAAVSANGGNASGYGAGGGGGATSDGFSSAFSGGRGSSGFVKISW